MKKFLSVILAAMVLTAAGCGEAEEKAETTTTTAAEAVQTEDTQSDEAETEATEAETEATEAETEATEAETEAAEAETEAPAASSELLTEEMAAFIEELKAEAPIYADYMYESSILPTAMGFAYEADLYGTGTNSKIEMSIYMSAMDKMAIITNTDGVNATIIFSGDKYYILSDAEKTALYMTLSAEDMASMSESMTASVQPAFSLEEATIETGTTDYNGGTYLYEKITTAEMGDVVIYADPDTKEVKYLESAGIAMEITFLNHEVDESVYEIPADYTVTDMSSLLAAE